MAKYTGFDKVADAKIPATERLIELCGKRWKFTKNITELVNACYTAYKYQWRALYEQSSRTFQAFQKTTTQTRRC